MYALLMHTEVNFFNSIFIYYIMGEVNKMLVLIYINFFCLIPENLFKK